MPVELITETVGYIPGGVNIGVVIGEGGEVALVDTGLNETAAKKALKAVREELGCEVTTILTTHAHADHFGGNATIVKRTGARVFAPALDEAIIRNPVLQPAMMFGGADPPASLRGGFLLADASPVDVLYPNGCFSLLGREFEVVPLAGHSPGQIGLIVDGVFFSADIVLPVEALAKYRVPYLYSLADHLASLKRVAGLEYQRAVPGHGGAVDSLDELIVVNRALIEQVLAWVLHETRQPAATDDIVASVLDLAQTPVHDDASYYLARPTILACLSHLSSVGAVTARIERNWQVWQAV